MLFTLVVKQLLRRPHKLLALNTTVYCFTSHVVLFQFRTIHDVFSLFVKSAHQGKFVQSTNKK